MDLATPTFVRPPAKKGNTEKQKSFSCKAPYTRQELHGDFFFPWRTYVYAFAIMITLCVCCDQRAYRHGRVDFLTRMPDNGLLQLSDKEEEYTGTHRVK